MLPLVSRYNIIPINKGFYNRFVRLSTPKWCCFECRSVTAVLTVKLSVVR